MCFYNFVLDPLSFPVGLVSTPVGLVFYMLYFNYVKTCGLVFSCLE